MPLTPIFDDHGTIVDWARTTAPTTTTVSAPPPRPALDWAVEDVQLEHRVRAPLEDTVRRVTSRTPADRPRDLADPFEDNIGEDVQLEHHGGPEKQCLRFCSSLD